MKVLQPNILTGMPYFSTGGCYGQVLTINKGTKRVFLSFVRTKHADKYDKIMPICGKTPRMQVLMNCTPWPRIRKAGDAPARYCDFSSASDKIRIK
jgi:hypothetical protein